jgi:hypothetical protein
MTGVSPFRTIATDPWHFGLASSISRPAYKYRNPSESEDAISLASSIPDLANRLLESGWQIHKPNGIAVDFP